MKGTSKSSNLIGNSPIHRPFWANPTLETPHKQCSKSLYHSIESWLVNRDCSWIIIPNILGSTIPQLILNQQGFRSHCSHQSQPSRAMAPVPPVTPCSAGAAARPWASARVRDATGPQPWWCCANASTRHRLRDGMGPMGQSNDPQSGIDSP